MSAKQWPFCLGLNVLSCHQTLDWCLMVLADYLWFQSSSDTWGHVSIHQDASYQILQNLEAMRYVLWIAKSLWNLAGSAAELPAKFQSNTNILFPNLMALRFYELWLYGRLKRPTGHLAVFCDVSRLVPCHVSQPLTGPLWCLPIMTVAFWCCKTSDWCLLMLPFYHGYFPMQRTLLISHGHCLPNNHKGHPKICPSGVSTTNAILG